MTRAKAMGLREIIVMLKRILGALWLGASLFFVTDAWAVGITAPATKQTHANHRQPNVVGPMPATDAKSATKEKKVTARAQSAVRPWVSPGWHKIESRLGSIGLDGTLHKSFDLGDDRETKLLGLRLELEHRLDLDAYGRAFSTWRIPALKGYLVPHGRKELVWKMPDGAIVRFERAIISHALSRAGDSSWLIRTTGPGDYEIRSLDGRGYWFRHGALTEVASPLLGNMNVSTQGGLIREIRLTDMAPSTPPLLHARYDEDGHCLRLQIGAKIVQTFSWNSSGQLASWQRADGSMVVFTYRHGLLSGITGAGKALQRLTWELNPGFGRGDAVWPAPVHLKSDCTHDYTYGATSKGYVITTSNRITGDLATTIFNPRLRSLEQLHNGKTLIADFHPEPNGRTALGEIEDGSGKILESYRYDSHGRLVSIQRRGEPERILRYDEGGRLMDFTSLTK